MYRRYILRAVEGHLPELKRVIAAYGERVVMKETLAQAWSALFAEPGGPAAPAVATARSIGTAADQARAALDRYNQAIAHLKSGDWAGFGTELDAMRELLEDMSRQSRPIARCVPLAGCDQLYLPWCAF